MAELLGVVASGLSVGSLAIQILGSLREILDFWSSIKNAPNENCQILEELQILAEFIYDLDHYDDAKGFNVIRSPATSKARKLCQNAADSVGAAVDDLKDGFKGNKAQCSWTALRAALREKRLKSCLARLERAKSMLCLAQQLYIQVNQQHTHSQLNYLVASYGPRCQTISSHQNLLAHHCQLQHIVTSTYVTHAGNLETLNLRHGTDYNWTSETSFWLLLGTLSVRIRKLTVRGNDRAQQIKDKIEYRFIPAPWTSFRQSFQIVSNKAYGRWQHHWQSYRIITDWDPVFSACLANDLKRIQLMCYQGQATPFDRTPSGLTLLHVAAAQSRPAICQWLINQGLDASVICEDYVFGFHVTPLMLAAQFSDFEHTGVTYPGIRAWWKGDMVNRPADVLDTFRICIESGQSDPMAGDGNNGRTTFYHHHGTTEQLKYLLDQDIFFVDLFGESLECACILNEIHRMRFDFFELVHERVCLALKSVTCKKLQWYKIRHLRSIAEMAWDVISDDTTKLSQLTSMTKTMALGGSDIHGLDFISSRRRPNTAHVTHLFSLILGSSGGSRLIGGQDSIRPEEHRNPAAVVHAWLVGLWEANVDLEIYLKEEERLARMRRAEDESFPWAVHESIRPLYDLHFTYGKYPIDCSVTLERVIMRRQECVEQGSTEDFNVQKADIPGAWIEDV